MRGRLVVLLLLGLCCARGATAEASQDEVLRIGTEHGLHTIDPQVAATPMELHVAEACFEGLCRIDPETLEPEPGLASHWDVSEDGRRWTFHLREGATWSDGTPLVAADAVRGLRRALDPITGAPFAYALEAIEGARAYAVYGRAVLALAGPKGLIAALRRFAARNPEGVDGDAWMRWIGQEQLPTMLRDSQDPLLRAAVDGTRERWSAEDLAGLTAALDAETARIEPEHRDGAARFGKDLGVRAVDARTVRIDLARPQPDLPRILAMPVAAPVPAAALARAPVRQGGKDDPKAKAAKKNAPRFNRRWWRAPDCPFSGPYVLRRRKAKRGARTFGVVLERNARYHDAASVRQRVIEVVEVEDAKENLRLFTDGTVAWARSWPREVTPQLARSPLMRLGEAGVVYYLALRCDHPALGDARVRRALAQSVDRDALLASLPGILARPATTFVPMAVPGHTAPDVALPFDPEAARKAFQAAVPKGADSLPPIELLYNVGGTHKDIAAFVAAQWREHLGLRVVPVGASWFEYRVRRRQGRFGIARMGWIGDAPDALDFLALFESGAPMNASRWSDAAFDELLATARGAGRADARAAALRAAEARLLGEGVPLVPLYWYRHGDLVHPWVRGFRTRAVGSEATGPGVHNLQGLHPLRGLWIERD